MRWSEIERLNRERELVGIYLSAHPLDEFSVILTDVCNTHMKDLDDELSLESRGDLTMGGIVTNVHVGMTKKGNPYGRVKIEDYSGSHEFSFFGNDWAKFQPFLNENSFVYLVGKIQPKQWRQDEKELHINSVEFLPEVKDKLITKFTVKLMLDALDEDFVAGFAELARKHPGNAELHFKIKDVSNDKPLDLISRQVRLDVGKEVVAFVTEKEMEYEVN